MNIIPVPTLILLQLIPFLVSIIVLHFVLFKPMLQYLEERNEKITGTKKSAIDLQQETQDKIQSLESQLKKVNKEIGERRSEERAKLMGHYNDRLHEARSEAEKGIKAQVEELAQEQAAARASMDEEANKIAALIATQTLGRSIAG